MKELFFFQSQDRNGQIFSTSKGFQASSAKNTYAEWYSKGEESGNPKEPG